MTARSILVKFDMPGSDRTRLTIGCLTMGDRPFPEPAGYESRFLIFFTVRGERGD